MSSIMTVGAKILVGAWCAVALGALAGVLWVSLAGRRIRPAADESRDESRREVSSPPLGRHPAGTPATRIYYCPAFNLYLAHSCESSSHEDVCVDDLLTLDDIALADCGADLYQVKARS